MNRLRTALVANGTLLLLICDAREVTAAEDGRFRFHKRQRLLMMYEVLGGLSHIIGADFNQYPLSALS